MLQDVGARLRRIAGVAGLGLDGEDGGLVPVEGDALHVGLVPVLLRGRARRHRHAGARQFLEDHVERQRPDVVVDRLLDPEADARTELVPAIDDAGVAVAPGHVGEPAEPA